MGLPDSSRSPRRRSNRPSWIGRGDLRQRDLVSRSRRAVRWLQPGLVVKRWMVTSGLGLLLALLGGAVWLDLKPIYWGLESINWLLKNITTVMPRGITGPLVLVIGGGLIWLGQSRSFGSIQQALAPEKDTVLVDALLAQGKLNRGPNIVAIGGGTGLSTLLSGLKRYSSNLTAIVTVADDGGSTGRLRQEFGVIAPGDIRQCIAALAEAEPLMSKLFQYRFTGGDGLEGHSFGNLFIVAMSEVTGNFEAAIHETSRVLNVRGTILPSTLEDVTLSAMTHEDEMVHGEHNISERGASIKEVYLNPPHAEAHPDAVRAILEADLIVIGPGSLFTSVLPNLIVEGIRKALQATTAMKVFVCNVATQEGETDGYSVQDHIEALEVHAGRGIVHAVVANNNIAATLPEEWHSKPVPISRSGGFAALSRLTIVEADVVSEENRYRHDSAKLAGTILRLYDERGSIPISSAPPPPEAQLLLSR